VDSIHWRISRAMPLALTAKIRKWDLRSSNAYPAIVLAEEITQSTRNIVN
jgi:hypothetical protein